jgi:hypothetical protein
MIRILIAGVMVLMAGSANALTNEALYRDCKPFSDRSFEPINEEDLYCLQYFIAAIEFSQNICLSTTEASETSPGIAFARSYFGGASGARLQNKAIIQFYVNYMTLHPEEWKYDPSENVRQAIKSIAPCE